MATKQKILIKRTTQTGKKPTVNTPDNPGNIEKGEFAINLADKAIYTVDNSDQLFLVNIGQETADKGEIFNLYTNTPEGDSKNSAAGQYSHAEGLSTKASKRSSHAEGAYTEASGENSHAEGIYTAASGDSSHAEGAQTTASGWSSHAEGYGTTASGEDSHAEGTQTKASVQSSHAEGEFTTASDLASHAEGTYSIASGKASHAEGRNTTASGYASHAEGMATIASGFGGSHAEGKTTTASGYSSHAEGQMTTASGNYSHAEGDDTIAGAYKCIKAYKGTGEVDHQLDEISWTKPNDIPAGQYEYQLWTTIGEASHTGGIGTRAQNTAETAIGKYNQTSDNQVFSIGNGKSDEERSNLFEVIGTKYGETTTTPEGETIQEPDSTSIVKAHADEIRLFPNQRIYFEGPTETQSIFPAFNASSTGGFDVGKSNLRYKNIFGAQLDLEDWQTVGDGFKAGVFFSPIYGMSWSHTRPYDSSVLASFNLSPTDGMYVGKKVTIENDDKTTTSFTKSINISPLGEIYTSSCDLQLQTKTSGNTVIGGKNSTTTINGELVLDHLNVDGLATINNFKTANASSATNGSIALGFETFANGIGSIAVGYRANSSGAGSVAVGNLAAAAGPNSIAVGNFASSGGDSSIAVGDRVKTTKGCESSFGICNASNTGTIHSIGIGTPSNPDAGTPQVNKNAVEVMHNGDVYITGVDEYNGTNPDASRTVQQMIMHIDCGEY